MITLWINWKYSYLLETSLFSIWLNNWKKMDGCIWIMCKIRRLYLRVFKVRKWEVEYGKKPRKVSFCWRLRFSNLIGKYKVGWNRKTENYSKQKQSYNQTKTEQKESSVRSEFYEKQPTNSKTVANFFAKRYNPSKWMRWHPLQLT